MNTQGLSKLLKQKRQLSGLTQAEVAKKLHVSRQAISNWETGRNLPDLLLVNQLAEIYDTSVGELINDDAKDKFRKKSVSYIYPLLMLSILATSRLTLPSSPISLLIIDGLILLSVTLLCLTNIKNFKVKLLSQLSSFIICLSCTFKSSLLNSFGLQTATFMTSLILVCQLVSTYHYQKRG